MRSRKTLGRVGPSASCFLGGIASRIRLRNGNVGGSDHLYRRRAAAVQLENAECIIEAHSRQIPAFDVRWSPSPLTATLPEGWLFWRDRRLPDRLISTDRAAASMGKIAIAPSPQVSGLPSDWFCLDHGRSLPIAKCRHLTMGNCHSPVTLCGSASTIHTYILVCTTIHTS